MAYRSRRTEIPKLMETLLPGVISGLLATAIVFVIQVVYVKVLRPWVEEFLYRDLKVEGRWLVTYPENEEFAEAVELSRNGHDVSGTVTVTGGPDKGRVYLLNGTFKNLILTASFAGKDETRLDRGCFTLQVKNNGQHMQGFSNYYQDDENEIACLECRWERGSA